MRGLGALLAASLLAGCLSAPPSAWPGAVPVAPGPPGEPVMSSPLPVLPIRVNERGEVEGVPSNLAAYRYCGHEDIAALSGSYAGREVLHYYLWEEAALSHDLWFEDRLGQPVRAADIPEGEGALALWRSDASERSDRLAFWVLRPPREVTIDAALDRTAVQGMMAGGLVAYSAASPYFCCTLGWHMSPLAEMQGHWEHLFDTCHFSTFEPWHLVPARLPPCSTSPHSPYPC